MDMRHRTVPLFAGLIPLLIARLPAAGQAPFERVAIDDSIKNPWAKIIADIDKDGFADIVIGGQTGPLAWYKYPQWTKSVIAEGGYRTVDGEAGDIDGDGDLDIVMGGLIWYENPLPASSPAGKPWTAHQVADHRTHDIELADLDRDGRLDIVSRDQSDFGTKAGDKVYLWRQEAGDKWTPKIIECPHGEGLALGDIDRDGDQDVVIGGLWFENDGRILDGAWQAHKFCDWHPSASVEVADIDGDGRPDIVLAPSELAGNWHRLSWFEAPADPKRGGWAEHVMVDRIECVIHGLATADFDGDGSIDIAISEMHQGEDPDEVAIFFNRDKGTRWDKQVLSTRGSHCIQAGDIGADGDMDLMGANWSGPFQPVELWENRSGVGAWHGTWEYRVPIRVGAAGFEREAAMVEVPLDFTALLRQLGRTAPGGTPKVRVVEVDASGRLMHEVIPVQFDRSPDCESETTLMGILTFMLWGRMAAQAEWVFHVYYDFRPQVTMTDIEPPHVTVADNVDHEGQPSFKISTPGATYYYHKRGAGFASMEDRDGNDWLSYNPGEGPVSRSGSGGKYRGIPNVVHPEGHFHPGGEECISRVLAAGPVRATVFSESGDGNWACRWDVFPNHARMTVLKADHPYWFLYEGTPGGRLDEDSDYCVRSDGTQTAANERWTGDLCAEGETAEWLYFGDEKMDRVLYLIHHSDDGEVDSYWPMNREMTVFGFGRNGLNKYLTQVPDQFTIGFCGSNEFPAVRRTVQSAYRPLMVTVGAPQARK
jgi:hypothetical protein